MVNSGRDRKSILFVEDHEETWEMMAFLLRGYKIAFARNCGEARRLAQRGYFDLYILDNWLPDGTGIELCHCIREFDPYTPILFYSATGHESEIEEVLRTCAQVYLVKPTGIYDLPQAVARLTSVASNEDSEAWRAGIAAVREELAIRHSEHSENVERTANAKERRSRAQEKLIRYKAEKAFLAAGGTRGNFARRWPSVFVKEVRPHRSGG